MGTKEEDEDALLYGDVGDSDDEAKETMAKQTNVVAGGVGGNGGGEGGGEGDDKEKELEMKNNGDDDGIGAKEKTISGDGAQTNHNNNNNTTSNAEKNDEDEEKSKSVYVANLTWWTTDVQVEQLASEFGVVKSVQFFTEKKNGKSKGCAVVEFTTAQSATSCAENLNKRAIDGKACVVTLAPAGSSGSNAMMGPRAPLGPPPDTAWKGPVPTKGGGVGGGIGMSTTQAQLNALQQQQKMKLLMMQQQMKAKLNAGAAKPTATTPPNAARKNAESTHSPANNNNNNNNNSNNNSPTTTTTTTTTRERPNSPLMANAAPHAARGRGGGRGGRGPRNRAESPPAGRGRKRARR